LGAAAGPELHPPTPAGEIMGARRGRLLHLRRREQHAEEGAWSRAHHHRGAVLFVVTSRPARRSGGAAATATIDAAGSSSCSAAALPLARTDLAPPPRRIPRTRAGEGGGAHRRPAEGVSHVRPWVPPPASTPDAGLGSSAGALGACREGRGEREAGWWGWGERRVGGGGEREVIKKLCVGHEGEI
jgi:hypothetical protein